MSLRNELIRLAYAKPHLRRELLPILKTSGELNVAETTLEQASAYASEFLDVESTWPEFRSNYTFLQGQIRKSKRFPRNLMPVIEPDDIRDFQKHVETKSVSLFKPWMAGHLPDASEGDIKLFIQDSPVKGGGITTKTCYIASGELIPTQDQIWWDKVVDAAKEHGPVNAESEVLNLPVIVSKEGHILDGHHRYASTVLSDPQLKIKALFIPIPIKALMQLGQEFGDAAGNQAKD